MKNINIQTYEFQYEVQPYQENCIENIINIFEKINSNEKFESIILDNAKNNKYPQEFSNNKNIDILMETGTGKTFTYIKLIFELNKNFGYKKFIVLVPTVAIREGTKANFDNTKNYFKQYYANSKDKEINTYIYEAGQISQIEHFINDENQLSCLIMTPASFNSKDNILNRPLEKDFYYKNAKTYLELLKIINPLIIIDEPHRFEGEAFKKYFEGFNNFYFRFGATFPSDKKVGSQRLSNVAYMLDSISAFKQKLVKQITVHTQDIIKNTQVLKEILKSGKNGKIKVVSYINNEIQVVDEELSVGSKFNNKVIKKINKDNIILYDDTKITLNDNYKLDETAIKLMIQDTIKIHFEKEPDLFNKGIKAITLFFIEHINQFRGINPYIKNIFKEQYLKIRNKTINKLKDNPQYSNYLKYLENDFDSTNNLQIHKGYFSGDKGTKDEKEKQAVDEILKDKKKLLSFNSPTRFVFSVWALQEGWDNPNVFTICKLAQTSSEISKLQQIGRGLRICVNQQLQRQTIDKFDGNEEQFLKINNLDIIVSNQEVEFVEKIQDEILNNSYLLKDTFTIKQIKQVLENKNFDNTKIHNIVMFMENKSLIKYQSTDVNGFEIYEKSENYLSDIEKIKQDSQNLPETLTLEDIDIIKDIFSSDIKKYVKDIKNAKKPKQIKIKDTHLKEFKILWEHINQKSIYFVENLQQEAENNLINNIVEKINNLEIEKIFLHHKKQVLNTNLLENKETAITTTELEPTKYECELDYINFCKNLSNITKTPITFIVKIINLLSKEFKENMLKNDILQAQKEIIAIIKEQLIQNIKANINYYGIDGKIYHSGVMYDKQNKFKQNLDVGDFGSIKNKEDLPENFSLKEQWLFEDVLMYDSDFEKEIILKDPYIKNIKVFAKLPKLNINTPQGKYNPDFCYAIETQNDKKIFLVVESKGYNTKADIPQKEKYKIEFAKKFFNKINEKFKNTNVEVVYRQRINRTDLLSLIKDVIKE